MNMKEKSFILAIISMITLFAFYLLFKAYLYVWCKLRKKYKNIEYSSNDFSLGNRLKFYIKFSAIFIIPTMVITFLTIYLLGYSFEILKDIIQLDKKAIDIFCIVVFVMLYVPSLFFIKYIIKYFFRLFKINFDESDKLCEELNTYNDKIPSIIITAVYTLFILALICIFWLGSLIL